MFPFCKLWKQTRPREHSKKWRTSLCKLIIPSSMNSYFSSSLPEWNFCNCLVRCIAQLHNLIFVYNLISFVGNVLVRSSASCKLLLLKLFVGFCFVYGFILKRTETLRASHHRVKDEKLFICSLLCPISLCFRSHLQQQLSHPQGFLTTTNLFSPRKFSFFHAQHNW